MKYCDEHVYICLSVSLSVCDSISGTANYGVHVACDRGLILLWQHCDMLCTSGFVDIVIFYIMIPMTHRVYAYNLTVVPPRPNSL